MKNGDYLARVARDGRVVIPKRIRERNSLSAGTLVKFMESGGTLSIVPVPSDPITKERGMLRGYNLTEELLRERHRG